MGAHVEVPTERVRLDHALIARGLATSRQRGQAFIRAGLVTVNGRRTDRPDMLVSPEAAIELAGRPRYVSRGGEKLAAALDAFGVDPQGRACLDVGASTGGFTDVLLQRGASSVTAVDVGYGQLAWSIRQDPRVRVLERVNIRDLDRLPVPADLATIDVSFISLRVVVPAVRQLLSPPGDILALVKPQFEVGKGRVGKGGVVRDPAQHQQVLHELGDFLATIGYQVVAEFPSPVLGSKGNREFFFHMRPNG